jgi:DNA-binding transcriptional regulator YdaS (Cro superfamily)
MNAEQIKIKQADYRMIANLLKVSPFYVRQIVEGRRGQNSLMAKKIVKAVDIVQEERKNAITIINKKINQLNDDLN